MIRRLVALLGLVALNSVIACASSAPSVYDFHDRILRPLAAQKADDVAEQNRLHVRKAFEKADQAPNDRWFEYVYWGLDALGVAGYGMPVRAASWRSSRAIISAPPPRTVMPS